LGGDRPAGGGLPGARPAGLGGDRPGGGGLPGSRPGGAGAPGGPSRSSPFTAPSGGDSGDKGKDGKGKSKGKGKDGKDKAQGDGLKGKLPFFGGKGKDKGDKGKSGDKPARPAGVADRGSSARPATALPGAASGRAAAPSASRPSTASRSRTQAKALPDARQAPRIVNRGLDLDRKLDLIGVALVVLGGIMLFGILPSMSFGLLPPVEGGLTGTIDHFLSQLFGWGKIVWPVLCFGVGIWLMLRYFGGQMFDIDYFRVVGTLVLYAGALAWLHMLQLVDDVAPTVEAFKPISYDLAVETGEGGGWFGHQIYFFLLSQLGDWGTLVLLIGWLVLGVMLTFNVSAIQIGQFVVGAFMFLRTRGNRNQRRLAQEVAQAETVTVARPGAPQAVPARSSPRQIPLTPATVTGTGAGQASGGSGGPSVASQEPPERPRPLIRRRGDEETTSSEDAAVSAAEAPVASAAAALASGVVAASAPGEKDKQPAEEAGRSRFRMPSLRGKPSAAEEPAQASDEKRAAPPVADEKTAEQESGSRLGRFGGLLKRGGSEPEAEQASGGGGRRGRQRDKDAAGKDADKADRKGEEKDEQPSRPSMARPLAAAAAGAAAGAALAFSRPDRRADEKALDALDIEDEDDDETSEEIAAPAETTPAPSPARSPFAPPRPGMGPSPLQRASFDDEDEDDEIDLEDEDEIEEGEDEVAASGAPERTPIRSGIPVPPRDSRPLPGMPARTLPGAPTAPAAPAAAASVPTPDDAPAASGDGDQAEGESYRPFSRPLPGRRIPPFDPARGAGNPSPQPGEAPAARVTPPDETNNDAGDEIPAPADEQPPVRDRAQALGLPPRPGMPPRRVPPVVESPVVVADETDDEDAPPARAPLSAAPLIGIKPDAASPRPGLTQTPPARVSPFAAPDMDADEDDDEATAPADEAIDLDDLDDEDGDDEVTTPAEEPRARPAFMSGDARAQGVFPRRPMPGSVAPVRPPLPARPGAAASDSDDDSEDEDRTAPAAPAGAGQPPERVFSGVPLRSGVTPAADEMSTNGSGDDAAKTAAPPEPETPAVQEQPAASVIDAPMVHSMIEALAATPDDTVRAEPEAAALPDDDPEEEAPAVAPVARPQTAADIQPQRVPSRPLPTETPPAPRREDVASVASAVASRPADLTRRDAVSLGALRDKDEDRPQPPTRTGPQKPHWEVPDFRDLLKKGSEQRVDDEILLDKARMIEDTLASFGAPGKVVEVNPGPVITQFGVEPDYLVNRSGKRTRVKVSSIARLDADLALALAARSIRVEAPVPGKGFVGIEVPNDKITAVNLYDVMDSPEFRRINSKLRIALGLSVDGTPVAADLTVMPHLLIAGTTGSGKSVCVNAIINCLLLSNAPEDLQFIMVDPKRVELTGYNGIPHLLSPVVVDLERVVGVLQWVQREMDDRYRRFAAVGARNIVDYNGKLRPEEKRMPYIIVVIDELADLMMLAPDETEKLLARLAQMARATGIHLIISTQRPSVDVVTGLIKANFPARIAFAVASMMDSRVILDQPGAEKLLGRGDMLYQSPDAPAPLRMQGVYVSDEEINNATRYWKTQGLNKSEPQEDGLVSFPKTNGNGRSASRPAMRADPGQQQAFWDDSNQPTFEVEDDEIGDGRDEMYDEAVELVKRLNKASISLLQRRLRIGYTRAARLIDIMENEGIVGPAESGSKPREVLRRD
jgi:S-DNA-T family DNA segregation ATPase FtsK/SpoIIIE